MLKLTATNLKEALEMERNEIFVYYNSATGRIDKLSFQEQSLTPSEANAPKATTPLVGDAGQI